MGIQVSVLEYAKIRGKNEKTIRRWIIDGMPVLKAKKRGEAHKVDTETAFEWELGAFQEKISAKYTSFDGEQEQARLTHAKANIAEMEEAEKRGELVPAGAVVAAWTAMVVAAKTRLLSVSSRIKQQLPDVSPVVLDVVDDISREALEELADEAVPKSIIAGLE